MDQRDGVAGSSQTSFGRAKARLVLASLTAAGCAVLYACGGSSGSGSSVAAPPRGNVLAVESRGTAETWLMEGIAQSTGLEALTGKPKCNVELKHFEYDTVGPDGKGATSSSAMMVPRGTDAACSGARPVVMFAHGTSFTKVKDQTAILTDLENDPMFMMMIFAAQGYIVVSPNFLGYNDSSLGYHPYLVAETNGAESVDALRAGRKVMAGDASVSFSPKLFLYGISEGGYVAMAAHKVIERDHAAEFTVRASMPSAGPYNYFKFYTNLFAQPGNPAFDVSTQLGITEGAEILVPMLFESLQKTHGAIYQTSPEEAFNAPYDKTIPGLFPTDAPVADLVRMGKLPLPTPQLNKLTGPGRLLSEEFRQKVASGALPKLDQAIRDNTLLGWTPKAPMALCHGPRDKVVPFYNSTDVVADMKARGATNVNLLNIDDPSTLSIAGPVAPFAFGAFQQAYRTGPVVNGGLDSYHYIFHLICPILAKGYFDQL
ncbi:S9 family peptidase [Ramlibacter sp. WS9]|uniref:alpha/beta hydrolase family protein n=1 Tax=Ramlibacter sp. WS9 TaxID=1882741 RepID=UPI0013051C5B|nr:lipase family protein [Ramlibacter sp. WS9]